ncbi:helix-turn-helix transcriptional regulator [Streptomyces halobius]|uniref:AAA family ATPase n=1 Tax=Streptomyces halobius TaxID=2879846 RepID=A0ABY4MHR8_9ACTN|nr:AAA family ATPase [Streptomyces halobius]UQA97200.1 AAA family ATPase [Streptomyces halobius]
MKLVDRVDQLAELEDLARCAREGASGVVLIGGSPGLGKTALLDTWTTRERFRGTRVLTARCSVAERELPFGAVRQLFEGTPGAAHIPAPGAAPAPPALFEVFDALYRTIRALCAEHAVLIAVDDLELCDRQSLQWLGYLTRRLGRIRALLAATATCTADTAATPAPGHRFVPELLDHPRCRHVELPALTTRGVEWLLRQGLGPPLGDDGLPDACWAATGGNPWLVHELLSTLRSRRTGVGGRLPEDLDGLVRQLRVRMTHARIHREPTEATALARVAAVLGDGADPHLVAAVSGLDERAATAAVQDLERIGVLRSGSPGIAFTDAALRAALESEVATAERSALRVRAARLSHDAGAGNEQVAGHLLHAAGQLAEPWVVPALRAAAGDALRRRAPEDATVYLRHALRQPVSGTEREHLLTELGRVLLYRDPAVACRYLSEAMTTIEDPGRRSRAAALLSTAHLLRGRPDTAVDVLTDGFDAATPAWQELAVRLRVQCMLARVTGVPHRAPATVVSTADTLTGETAAGRTASDGAWRLGIQALDAMLTGCSATRTRALATEAFRSGLVAREGCSELAFFVALSLVCTDDLTDAVRAFSEIGAGAERAGARILLALAALGRSMVHQRRGDIREALATGATAVDEFFELPPNCFRGGAAAHLITVLLDDGRLDEAGALARRTTGYGDDGDVDGWERAVVSLAVGRLRAASGDIQGSLAQVLDCGRRLDRHGLSNPALLTWRSDAAVLHATLGERERARHLAGEELRLAERWGTPRVAGRALWALGVATGGEEGRRMLATAVTRQEEAGARLELIRTLIDYGVAESATGDLRQGRAHLRRAVDLAHRCGAARLVERASAELAKTGARPRSSGGDRWSSLTPGELRVARLAASGARNREIAARLHVTVRAVERHLTSAYRKLGVAGRTELGELFSRG